MKPLLRPHTTRSSFPFTDEKSTKDCSGIHFGFGCDCFVTENVVRSVSATEHDYSGSERESKQMMLMIVKQLIKYANLLLRNNSSSRYQGKNKCLS